MISNELKLSKQIYDLNDIIFSVRNYDGIADILIHQDDCYTICEFTNCVYDPAQTIKEFENYLIQYSNSKGYIK